MPSSQPISSAVQVCAECDIADCYHIRQHNQRDFVTIEWFDWVPGFMEPETGSHCLVTFDNGKVSYCSYSIPRNGLPYWTSVDKRPLASKVVSYAHKPRPARH